MQLKVNCPSFVSSYEGDISMTWLSNCTGRIILGKADRVYVVINQVFDLKLNLIKQCEQTEAFYYYYIAAFWVRVRFSTKSPLNNTNKLHRLG